MALQYVHDFLDRIITGGPGNNPEFDAQRALWLQNITREQLLQDLTRVLTKDGPDSTRWACLRPNEIRTIQTIFEARKGSNDYWTKDTLSSYLESQVSASSKAHLQACSGILSRCVFHFAAYPFSTAEVSLKRLSCDDLTRAVAFLSGRDREIFVTAGIISNQEIGRERTEEMSYEAIFRSLAPSKPQAGEEVEKDLQRSNDDVVDVLVEAQPILNGKTAHLPRESLFEVANRLSSGRLPLQSISIPGEELVPLLGFFVQMLDGITTDTSGKASALARKLEGISTTISESSGASVTFQELENAGPHSFSHLQDAFAVLFSTFVQPNGVGHASRSEKSKAAFDLGSLRPHSAQWN